MHRPTATIPRFLLPHETRFLSGGFLRRRGEGLWNSCDGFPPAATILTLLDVVPFERKRVLQNARYTSRYSIDNRLPLIDFVKILSRNENASYILGIFIRNIKSDMFVAIRLEFYSFVFLNRIYNRSWFNARSDTVLSSIDYRRNTLCDIYARTRRVVYVIRAVISTEKRCQSWKCDGFTKPYDAQCTSRLILSPLGTERAKFERSKRIVKCITTLQFSVSRYTLKVGMKFSVCTRTK